MAKLDNHEILVMLIKRIETYFGRNINEEHLLTQRQRDIGDYLNSVFEERFPGKWSLGKCTYVPRSYVSDKKTTA